IPANTWTVSVDGAQKYQSTLNRTSIDRVAFSMAPAFSTESDEPSTKAYVDNVRVDCTSVFGSALLIKDLAANAAARTATLSANVNPQDAETSVTFTYGTPFFPEESTQTQIIPRGTTYFPVSVGIYGLQPHATYQYRLVAKNVLGTTTEESNFETGNTDPVAA